jgi:hypothetical protein
MDYSEILGCDFIDILSERNSAAVSAHRIMRLKERCGLHTLPLRGVAQR